MVGRKVQESRDARSVWAAVPNVALTEKNRRVRYELTSCSCGRQRPVDPTLFIGKACYDQPRPTQNHTISLLT